MNFGGYMKVIENKRSREVILDDKCKIGGVIVKEKCISCNYSLVYFDKYDCNFCPKCNEWETEK